MEGVLTIVQVLRIEPPIPPDAQNKGRKSFKVHFPDGTTMFAMPEIGQQLQAGGTYEFETSQDGYQNVWINKFSISNGSAQPAAAQGGSPGWEPPGTANPPQGAVAAPTGQLEGLQRGSTSRSIVLQCIIKSCAAHSGNTQEADVWLKWYGDNL
jgi:hypothetical protein